MQISQIYITTEAVLNRNGERPVHFSFDCVTDYSPTFKRAISTYAVSTQANLADHIFKENTTVKLVGMITASPIFENIPNNLLDGEQNLARVQKAYIELKRLHESDTPLTLVTEFDIISDVYLTEITPVQDNNAILFSLNFEQQRFASYQTTTLVQKVSPKLKSDASNTTTQSGADEKYHKDDPTGTKKINPDDPFSKKWSTFWENRKAETLEYGDVVSKDVEVPKM